MLDDLVEVIETLKSRIDEHRSVLQGNEAQTRLSLIDPLLRALGWDTADPLLVRPEYVVGGRRADYALLNAQREVVVFLEAKNLGENLAGHRSQVVAYASELGIRFPALTNGNDWEVYDNSQLVPIDQRRVLNLSITGTDAAKCALQFLLLWRPNLASGQPIEANEPIMGTEPKLAAIPQVSEPQYPAITTNVPPAQAVSPPADAGWMILRDFAPVTGTRPPVAIRFPNGEVNEIRQWRGPLVEVAEWLIRNGDMIEVRYPLTIGRQKSNCIINMEPQHPNGKDFISPQKLSNGTFLNCNYNAPDTVRICVALLEHFGKDPASVHIQVG